MKVFRRRKHKINAEVERIPFERIVKETFQKYKDNIMCSQETIDNMINDITEKIREQLKEIK